MRRSYVEEHTVSIELYGFGPRGLKLLRGAAIDMRTYESHDAEPVYWEPIEDSRQRFYLVRAAVLREGKPLSLSQAKLGT